MNTGDCSHQHEHGNCRQYLDSLSDYVDGCLSEELCAELEAHMAECQNCRVVVDTLSRTISLYHQLPAPELPNAVRERLYKVLDLRSFLTSGEGDQEG